MCRAAVEPEAGFLLSPSALQCFPLVKENKISIPVLSRVLVIPNYDKLM